MTTFQQSWYDPPLNPALTADEVHVWRMALNRSIDDVQGLQTLLAPEEISRADRFYFGKDRQRYLVVHGVVRVILGRYLDRQPGQLRFVFGDYGKPALAPTAATRELSFNLSHAHELALLAVTRDRQLGIDLEHVRPIPEVEQIAERILSAEEKEMYRVLPEPDKLEAFFKYWTCKEAYIKARGEGLSLPLDQFQVDPILGEAAPLLSVKGDPHEASRWSLRKLVPAPGYVAALAVEGEACRVAHWHYSGQAKVETT